VMPTAVSCLTGTARRFFPYIQDKFIANALNDLKFFNCHKKSPRAKPLRGSS